MPDAGDLLTAFREELIAAGHVRRPSEPGPTTGPPYPMRIESAEGAAAPGELSDEEHDHDELVLSIHHDGDVAAGNYDGTITRIVNVDYRSRGNAALRAAMELDNMIVARLIRPETNYGYGFPMGTAGFVFVHQASVFAGLGPVSRERGGDGEPLFHHAAKYSIETVR